MNLSIQCVFFRAIILNYIMIIINFPLFIKKYIPDFYLVQPPDLQQQVCRQSL